MICFSDKPMSTECLESILHTLAEGLFLVDLSGTIRYCNKALEDLIGKSRDQIVGHKCCSIMMEKCEPPPTCGLFSDGFVENTECHLVHSNGQRIPVLKNARILKDQSGTVIGAVETLTDLSILRTTQTRLEELEASVRNRAVQDKIIGHSQAIRDVFNLIDLAAASNATVLLTGETGTGKELVAQAIHQNSSRHSAPIIKLNCSALPESLLESELFGHARGSFTGAIRDKVGRFESADGGTLFLDEIGELSPLIQVKLLRFLQEHEFERVGENITRKADVRIIAATNRDLRKLVHEGQFRDDLFYRLKVFPIHLPALRERKEDIGPLVDYFMAKFSSETGKNITGYNHDAAVTLMDYCWPGNIRELENAIEHAFVTCKEATIGIFDLPLEIRRVELRKGICSTQPGEPARETYAQPLKRTVSDEEFLEILKNSGYNKSETARKLAIDRTTVWRRMKRLGVAPRSNR